MYKVEVEIPAGTMCQGEDGKMCVMARYTKKWDAYNCKMYNRILKGEQKPRKCQQCIEYCEGKKEDAQHEEA